MPFFEEWKLFEMPLPGYLGYLPFALECAAALALLDRLMVRWSAASAAVALIALLGFHVALEATAFPRSTLSTTRDLPPLEAGLAEVAHMGMAHAQRLQELGIRDVPALAAADAAELHRRLEASGSAPPESVLRLWKRAAQRKLR